MSEVAESRPRGDSRGNNGGGGNPSSRNNAGNNGSQPPTNNSSTNENFSQSQQAGSGTNSGSHAQQDFSWRVGQQQMEAYNNFYYPSPGYSPFSGDIRDSIAAIWSRTSPSGEGFAAASGGYGQGEGFAAAAAGQFAANLNFAPTSEISMFGAAAAGAAAGDYSAYGQYGFGPQYTQWPDNNAGGNSNNSGSNNSNRNYSYLNSAQGGGGRGGAGAGDLMDVHHGLEGMKLTNSRKDNSLGGVKSGGGQSGPSGGKMSWASVASQPAKPQPQPKTAKKPGVLPPPSIISSNTAKAPPVPQQTPSEKLMMPPHPPPQHPPSSSNLLMQHPPPPGPGPHQVPPPNMPPMMNNHHDGGFRGAPPSMQPQHQSSNNRGSMMGGGPPSNQGPRANNRGGQPQTNGTVVPKSAMGGGGHSVSPNQGAGGPGGVQVMSHPILENLRSVNEYNPKSFDMSPKNARYFVIKSFSEDDIHRSIKYEIWCSTEHGNKRLDAAFKAQGGAGPIFLFFSVNGSGHFCGMAEMLSPLDYSNSGSSVWVQDKFKGQFKVKWIYVKDVPNSQLRHIRLENNENKPVTNSRDTQEVPPEKGKMVLKIIHGYKHATSLFDDFVHYEKKQEEEEVKKKHHHSDHPQHHHNSHHRDSQQQQPHYRDRGDRQQQDRPRRRDGGEREQHGQRDHRGGPGGPGGKPLKQH